MLVTLSKTEFPAALEEKGAGRAPPAQGNAQGASTLRRMPNRR